jgi:hypothetical protein
MAGCKIDDVNEVADSRAIRSAVNRLPQTNRLYCFHCATNDSRLFGTPKEPSMSPLSCAPTGVKYRKIPLRQSSSAR